MLLKFTQDAWYNGELIAKSGEIKNISEENGFALRWIKRGAIEVQEQVPGYDPGHQLDEVVDTQAGEVFASAEEILGGEEEIAIPEVKVENKKGKNTKGK